MTREPAPSPPEPAPIPAAPAPVPAWARWVHRHRVGVLVLVLGTVLGLDQASKVWARDTLSRPLPVDAQGIVHHTPVKVLQVVRGIWHFRYVENPAAAFSLTRSIPEHIRLPLLKGVGYLAMGLLLVWLLRMREPDGLLVLALCSVLGGALGNALDRHLYGYVIDFIDWRLTRFFPGLPPWPTFNIADVAIVCGGLLFVYRSFFPLESATETVAALPSGAAEDERVTPDTDESTPGEAGPLNQEAV